MSGLFLEVYCHFTDIKMNTSVNSPAQAGKPSRLLDRYNLLRFVIQSPWATHLDIRVFTAITDQWYRGRETASISARQIAAAIGAKRRLTDIVASVHRLTERNVLLIVRQGAGTRATDYALNFDLVLAEIANAEPS